MDDAVDHIVERWASMRPDLDTEPLHVVLRLQRAARLLDQGIRRHFALHGLEPWEFDVLAALRRAEGDAPLRMSELADATMVSPAALTNRIDRLVCKGYVTRATDAANRRLVRTTLTDEGRTLVDSLIDGHAASDAELVGGLTDREQRQLTRLLRRLLLSMEGGV